MNMPADFGSQDDHDQPKRKSSSSSFLPLILLVIGLIMLGFMLSRLLYWQPPQQTTITEQTEVVGAGETSGETSGELSGDRAGSKAGNRTGDEAGDGAGNILGEAEISGQLSQDGSEELLAPPPPQEFDFYNILTGEQAQLFDRQQPVETQRQNTYALVIEYFISYDQALSRSEDLVELKVKPVKVEPYMREGALSFRLRVGPYTSRSQANAMRDILYDHDIKHRLVVK